jgi:hypothetical protein
MVDTTFRRSSTLGGRLDRQTYTGAGRNRLCIDQRRQTIRKTATAHSGKCNQRAPAVSVSHRADPMVRAADAVTTAFTMSDVPTADVAVAGSGQLAGRSELSTAAALRWAWWAAVLSLCGVLVGPLFIVDMPPLVDYPNHLARAFVLTSLPSDPVLATFYAAHWTIIPNLATDLIAPPLMRVLPVHDAGRLLIAAAVLLPVLGAIAYSRVLGGRWWCLAVGLIAYNGTLLEGFLNFSLSVGLALLLAAAWLRWREAHPAPTIALGVAGAVVLFACHLMGLVFFAALLASAELFWLLRDQPEPSVPQRRDIIRRLGVLVHLAISRAFVGVVVFAAPAALYSVSQLQTLGGDSEFRPLAAKLTQLLEPFVNYSLTLDIVTAVVVLAFPCVCLVLGRGRIFGPAAFASGGLLIVYLAAPYAWKGTYQLDTRFVIMLGFMLFAGFAPVRWPAWLRRLAAATVVLLFVARMALLTTAWAEHRTDLADLRQALAPVLPGQAVYVASVSPADPEAYWARAPWSRRLSDNVQTDSHLGALALMERRAWWPFEFDNPSQQPIVTKEPYLSLAGRSGDLPDQSSLLKANLCDFDAVLLTQADAAPDLPERRFHLQVRAGFAALYTIKVCRPEE